MCELWVLDQMNENNDVSYEELRNLNMSCEWLNFGQLSHFS